MATSMVIRAAAIILMMYDSLNISPESFPNGPNIDTKITPNFGKLPPVLCLIMPRCRAWRLKLTGT